MACSLALIMEVLLMQKKMAEEAKKSGEQTNVIILCRSSENVLREQAVYGLLCGIFTDISHIVHGIDLSWYYICRVFSS